ncbi:MAG: ABC transporter permease subunit [Candidatus Promineifilaceae bacterium]
MAELSPKPPYSGQEAIPFWRDGRVIGVLAQIIFVIVVLAVTGWLVNNVAGNLTKLGESQFLCRDGSSSFRCAFDFLRLDASFDISESVIKYDPSDSYARALMVGALNTVKVGFFGIVLATILGTVTGIARLSQNWLVRNVAGVYIDIMRNTPLLLQLFFLFFGVILVFPAINEAIQLLGLPIYLSQRGIDLPGIVFMPSFGIWLAFIVLGFIQAQAINIYLSRMEEKTGKERNRLAWAIGSFLIVAFIGWFAASAAGADNQAILAVNTTRIREFSDMADQMGNRLGIDSLGDIDSMVANETLSQEEIDAAAYTICGIRDDPALVNLTAQLKSQHIPYTLDRLTRVDQATEAYGAGECEIYVASKSTLAAERNLLENPSLHRLITVPETPIRIDMPQIEGLNFVGGIKLTPNFAAILIGLVLYTGAFIAEIVRAGIQSVPKGQSEAARALGLSETQRLRLVVLPQALRVIIPPLTSQYLNLVKNSSLAIAVGFPDLWSTSYTTMNQSGRNIQGFVLVMGTYLSFSLFISFVLNWYNRRIALVER